MGVYGYLIRTLGNSIFTLLFLFLLGGELDFRARVEGFRIF